MNNVQYATSMFYIEYLVQIYIYRYNKSQYLILNEYMTMQLAPLIVMKPMITQYNQYPIGIIYHWQNCTVISMGDIEYLV